MTGQFQESPGQGFTRRRPYRRIAAPQILFLADGRQKALGHIPLGGGADAGVLLRLAEKNLPLKLMEPAVEAFENLLRFLDDMGQLTVREPGQIGHVHLAVVPQGQEGGARS